MVLIGLTYKSDDWETIFQPSSLELLIYNNPWGYRVDLTPDVIEQLISEPTIVTIKE